MPEEVDEMIYLAGPDVFRGDAASRLAAKAACIGAIIGREVITPFEVNSDIRIEAGAMESAVAIARNNYGAVARCCLVLADLSPFRGVHADPGTVAEVAYAHALGKPVVAYSTDPRDLAPRCAVDVDADSGELVDDDGLMVESFASFDNLMLLPVLLPPGATDPARLRLVRPGFGEVGCGGSDDRAGTDSGTEMVLVERAAHLARGVLDGIA